MGAEISVYLPNIPGQFSRVLMALHSKRLQVRGFNVDGGGALRQLHLLFTNVHEAERAKVALADYNYEVISTEVLLLSSDVPWALLRITEVLAGNDINIDGGYSVGQTESGEELFVLKVADGQAASALECLAAYGFTERDPLDSATAPLPSAS